MPAPDQQGRHRLLGAPQPLASWEEMVLVECQQDHVGLWEAVVYAHDFDPSLDRPQIVAALERLLTLGLVEAGEPAEDGRGFKPWQGTPHFIAKRIDREWRKLGHDPQLGDIVWLNTTRKGDALVRKLGLV